MTTRELPDDSAFPVLAGLAGPVLLLPAALPVAGVAFQLGGVLLALVACGLVLAAGPLYAAVQRRSIGWGLYAALWLAVPFLLAAVFLAVALSGPMG